MLRLFHVIKRLKVVRVDGALESATSCVSKIYGIGEVNDTTEAVSGRVGSETSSSARNT